MAQAGLLTVDDIASTASLDVTVLAGADGLQRTVLWAHSCEMPDPAQWLGPDELLMTVGLCVPRDPGGQVEFVRSLDQAGLAGVMVGDHEMLPPLSEAMFEEANRRSFPVMLVGAATPYAVVARHVAAANTSSQIVQVLQLSKLYHLAADIDRDPVELTKDLVKLLGVGMRVVDQSTGITVLGADHPSTQTSEPSLRRVPLQGRQQVELRLIEHRGEELAGFLLIHLKKILEVNVDRILTVAERRAERSSRALQALLNGVRPPEVDEILAPHRASDGFRVAACAVADGSRTAKAVALRDLPILVGPGRTTMLALVPTAEIPRMRALAAEAQIRLGVSSVFTDYADTRAAGGEAKRVLGAAQDTDDLWTEFEGTAISVLARSRREASDIVTGVLGPLSDDTPPMTKLRDTLFAFLRNDRRWNDTAAELCIHRQTLSYRLTRIEETTGLSLQSSSDLSAFWIAYQAWTSTRS